MLSQSFIFTALHAERRSPLPKSAVVVVIKSRQVVLVQMLVSVSVYC